MGTKKEVYILSNKVLTVSSLNKYYGSRSILNNLSFEIYEGEIFGLIGPNGSGKTTLIRVLSGLSPLTSGKVLISGYSIRGNIEKALANVGVVVENCRPNPFMTGRQNLKFYAKLNKNKISNEDINHIVDLVGLSSRINKRVSSYSDGELQRINLAQALIGNPKLLLLDEPTMGLDVNDVIDLRRILRSISRQNNMAILLCSNNSKDIESICDTVAIFDNGSILELRSLDDIKRESTQEKSVRIHLDYPNYAGKILHQEFKINVELAGNSIIIPAGKLKADACLSALKKRGITIFGTEVITKSLEELYLDVINEAKRRHLKGGKR